MTGRSGRRLLLLGNGAVFIGIVLVALPASAGYGEAWALAHHLPFPALATTAAAVLIAAVAHIGPIMAAVPGLGLRRGFVLSQSNFAVSNLMPAGAVVSAGISWSMLVRWGVSKTRAVAGLTLTGTLGVAVGVGLPVLAVVVLAVAEHLDPVMLPFVAGGASLAGLALAGTVALLASRSLLTVVIRLAKAGQRRWRGDRPGRDLAAGILRWRAQTATTGGQRWPQITAALVLTHLAQFAVLLIPLTALQIQWGQPRVAPLEAFAVFSLARVLGYAPVTPGGLGTVDAAMVFMLGWLSVAPDVALAAVLVWRAFVTGPQALIGIGSLALWRASLHRPGPGIGEGEPWLGRKLHRLTFTALSVGPWRQTVLRRAFEQRYRDRDPWDYRSSAYEMRKAEALVAATSDLRPREILEIGCAEGEVSARLLTAHPQARLTAVDIAPTAVERCRRRLEGYGSRARVLESDASSASAPGQVDLVVLSEVLYYLGGPAGVRRSLSTVARLLGPGAVAVLAHPHPDAPALHAAACAAMGMTVTRSVEFPDESRPVLVQVCRRMGH